MENVQRLKTMGIIIWLAGALFCAAQRPSAPVIRSIRPVATQPIAVLPRDAQPYGLYSLLNEIETNSHSADQSISPEAVQPVDRFPLNATPYGIDPRLHVVPTNGPAIRIINVSSNVVWDGAHIEFLTNSATGQTNELGTWVPDAYHDRKILFHLDEVETIHDPNGKFRAVGTNYNIRTGRFTTRWRYEIPREVVSGNLTTNWVKVLTMKGMLPSIIDSGTVELGLVSDGRVIWR